MEEFEPLDRVLLLSGCKIFKHGRLVTILNNIQLITVMAIEILLITSLTSVTDSSMSKAYVLAYYIPAYAGQVIFLTVMRRNQKSLYSHLKQVMTGITSEKRQRLRKISAVYTAIIVTFNLVAASGYLSSTIEYHIQTTITTNGGFGIALWYMDAYIMILGRWVIVSCFLSTFLIQTASYFEQTFFAQLRRYLKEWKRCDISQVLLEIHIVSIVKKRTMSLMGVTPCLVVAYVFVATSGIIIELKYAGVDRDTVMEVFILSGFIASLVYMTFVSGECTRSAEQAADSIEFVILSHGHSNWRQILGPLRDLSTMQHQSCGLFALNRPFVLSFVSSLVTFTALLTQILVDVSSEKKNITG